MFHVSGELDMATAPAIASELLANSSIRVVDLSDVTFIDVAGMRGLADTIRSAPQRIVVRAPSPCVRRLLSVAGHDPLGGDLHPF